MSGSTHHSRSYDSDFYRDRGGAAESARRILPIVASLVPARSVVDIGCGDGSWLAAWEALGVADTMGLEGPWIEERQLKIPTSRFRRADLTEKFALDRSFDLAMSMEVAEHLPAASAEGFVASLVRLAPVILFSAAIPGQGGVHHVNEQWPDYWARMFRSHGYRPIDALRPRLWNGSGIAYWYKQNLLIFASDAALAASPALAAVAAVTPAEPLALIHPELYATTRRTGAPRLGRWLKMGPAALRRTLAGKPARERS